MKAFILMLLIVSASVNTAEVDLRYQFRIGDQYECLQQTAQTSKQTFPGMGDMGMEGVVNGAMSMKVVELLPSGSARFEAFYTKLKIATSSMLLNMSMDSEGDQEEDSHRLMKAMMNQSFHFVMNRSGKVEKVEGTDNLYAKLSATGVDEDVIEKTKKTLSQTLNDNSLKAILTNGFIYYPGKNVSQGHSWKTENDLMMTFPMKVESTWTLAKLEGKTANILSDARMINSDKEKVLSLPNGMKAKSDLNGKQSIDGTVNVQTGWPTEVKVKSELKGTMTLLAGGFIPQDMILPTQMVINTTYTIRKK